MSDHYQELAKQFLDLWQDQTRTMMQDERFLDAMLGMLQGNNLNPFATPTTPMEKEHVRPRRKPAASPDATVHDHVDDGVATLHERLERCEQRLAILERCVASYSTEQADGADRKTGNRPKTRRRRPAGSK